MIENLVYLRKSDLTFKKGGTRSGNHKQNDEVLHFFCELWNPLATIQEK